ncbi:MAG: DUF4160 domain-containing protein [Coriobacteriales bacterium]|nr:DUF4160 domain-containing protein [Coriobacteriales bacterium]
MPELASIDSLIVRLFFHDVVQRNEPHEHVKYAEFAAVYNIDGNLLAGTLPAKQHKLLIDWLEIHIEEVKLHRALRPALTLHSKVRNELCLSRSCHSWNQSVPKVSAVA